MRVSLFYNGGAGEGVPLDDICGAIKRHGHDLVRVVEKEDDAKRLLDEFTDIVVAAGGDGTVALAARLLAHRGIPLAILPIGTANNIAKSIGIGGSIGDLASGWKTACRVPFDLGVADGAWGHCQFAEAVGAGLIPAVIADMQARSDGDELAVPAKVTGAVRATRRVLSRLQPVEMTIVADGIEATGEFILVEVLNIRSLGPNLIFSTSATPSDGLFTVVTAGDEHRDEIARYLQELLEGRDSALSLPSTRARKVTLHNDTDLHLDDEVLAASPSQTVSIRIDPCALEVLA
jgi:diacylglycerol kinase (ATP)